MKSLFTALFLLACLSAFTQNKQPDNLVQFSGVVYNLDSNSVVPYVTIINKTQRNDVKASNYQGYFSFVAHQGDTIIFSSVGYSKEALVIPSNIKDHSYTVMVRLKPEVVNLPVVRVYPWASLDQFNREFMTMKIADDDLEIAKKNTSKASLLAVSKTLPMDATEMNNINFQNNHVALTNKNINQRGANPLFNPFAWGALIQQITQGDKSRNGDQ
ncbi:hypothetical protein GS399_02595 [Pedobacter sp. HMF7647]|uniref:Carboxypeptidase-like regulatory domain-containing protein n=2 Tax=Hufsiella arboris TaxID=2695275 RepID=A0A7K1Y5H5_9SPHI|nr:hypothetical protein [Hufsiella arboris]